MSTAKKSPSKKTHPAKKLSKSILLANIAVMEQKVNLLIQFNQSLLYALAKNLPSIDKDLKDVVSQFLKQNDAIEAGGYQMILTGHGLNGVAEAANIKTPEDVKVYEAKKVQPVGTGVDVRPVIERLEHYLTVRGEKGPQFVDVASSGFYDHILDTETDLSKQDIIHLKDALFYIRTQQFTGFILRLQLDKNNILLFSPMEGIGMLTYSPMEEGWVKHNNTDYLDVALALEKIEGLFAKANIHDVSIAEFKRLGKSLSKLSDEQAEALNVSNDENGTSIEIAEIFKLSLPNKGTPAITSVRDDLQWKDLSLPTRRYIWREVQQKIEAALQDAAV